MARNIMINRSLIPGPIAIHVGEPVVVMLHLLLDADDVIGDKWSAAPSGGGLTFTPTDVEVPVGAVSPLIIQWTCVTGFTQAGAHQVSICKLMGNGADPAIPAFTIDFQVTAAPQAQPTQPQPAPAARQRQNRRIAHPQPAATPPNNNWLKGLSIATMVISGIVLLSLATLVWILVDTMRLSNASYTPPVKTPSTQEESVLTKPGGRIVASDNPTAIIKEMKAASKKSSP